MLALRISVSPQFLVENVHTKGELKMTGNCLKASRPFLSFDKNFDSHPHLVLIKELFIQERGKRFKFDTYSVDIVG